MGAGGLLFIRMSRGVSFTGRAWWVLPLGLRLLVLLLAGVPLFGDEQERFVCGTVQPGCAAACFDALAPVSVLRLWLVHLALLALPHALFATCVVHALQSRPGGGGGGGGLFSGPSREVVPLRFRCAYFLVVLLRVLLEVAFGAGQLLLAGWSVPRRFLCYEAPCSSGVECYVSRPTEKTWMLGLMLGLASLSVLLSLAELASSAKALARRRREVLMEEGSGGEQSSMAAATTAEDGGVLSSRGTVSRGGLAEEKLAAVPNGAARHAKVKGEARPTPTLAPTHPVPHSHRRPPLARRPDRGPRSRPPAPTGVRKLDRDTPVGPSADSRDQRTWV